MLLPAFAAMGGVIATLASWFRFHGINGVAACTERSEVSHTSGFCFFFIGWCPHQPKRQCTKFNV